MRNRIPTVRQVLGRLRASLGVSSDKELARELGISPSTLSSWRQRDAIPYSFCVEYARAKGVSLDWLIFGDAGEGLDAYAATLVLKHIRGVLALCEIDEIDVSVLGQIFANRYANFCTLLDEVVAAGLTRRQAMEAVQRALKERPEDVIIEALELQKDRIAEGDQ